MNYVTLGKTGLKAAVVSFGGIPIQRADGANTKAVVDKLEEYGINYIDTARGYTVSEEYLGAALEGRRDKFILATKSMSRDAASMAADVETSLRNLRTGYIDLYQLHNLPEKDIEKVFGPGGGQFIFHAGVNRCLFALQNAERRQHRRCGADCGHDLACGGKLGTDLAHRGIGFQVVYTRNAAGQDGGIKSGIIQLFGQGIRHNADAAGRFDDLFAAHGSNRYFHTGTAQQIHAQKALALFQAGRKKDNSFAHTKHSFTK